MYGCDHLYVPTSSYATAMVYTEVYKLVEDSHWKELKVTLANIHVI